MEFLFRITICTRFDALTSEYSCVYGLRIYEFYFERPLHIFCYQSDWLKHHKYNHKLFINSPLTTRFFFAPIAVLCFLVKFEKTESFLDSLWSIFRLDADAEPGWTSILTLFIFSLFGFRFWFCVFGLGKTWLSTASYEYTLVALSIIAP